MAVGVCLPVLSLPVAAQVSSPTTPSSPSGSTINNTDVVPMQGTPVRTGLPASQPDITLPPLNTEAEPATSPSPLDEGLPRPATPVAPSTGPSPMTGQTVPAAPGSVTSTTPGLSDEGLDPVVLNQAPPSSPIVLQGQLTKRQELPIDLETVLKLVQEQGLPMDRDTELARREKTRFYRTLSDMLPDVVGTYQQSKLSGVIQLFGNQTIPVELTKYQPQVLGRWTIFPGGTQIFESVAARRRYKVTRFNLEETLQEQLSRAAEEFYQLVGTQLQIISVLKSSEEARSEQAYNQARLDAGIGTKLDVMRAESQVIQRERDMIEAERNLAVAEQNLLNRLNLDPDIDLQLNRNDISLRRLVPRETPVEALLAMAKANDPALREMEADIKALKADLWAIISRVVPSVTLEGYINGTGPSLDALGRTKFAALFVEANLLENLGLAIPLDAKIKRHEIKQRQVELKILNRNVESAVVNAHLDTVAALKALEVAEEQLRVDEEAYRLAVGRYRAGLAILLDVLAAENVLFNSRTQLNQAIVTYDRTQVRLVEVVGRASIPNLLNGIMVSNDATTQPSP